VLWALHELDTRVVVMLSQLGQVAVGDRCLGGLVQVCRTNETAVVGDTEREVGREVLVQGAFSVDHLGRVDELGVTRDLRVSEVRFIAVAERVRVNVILGVVEEGIGFISVVCGLKSESRPRVLIQALPLDSVQVAQLLTSGRLERTGNDHCDQFVIV